MLALALVLLWTKLLEQAEHYYYYYYYELYSHMTGNDVSDGNKRNVEGSELG